VRSGALGGKGNSRLDHGVIWIYSLMKSPLIEGFVEKQYEIKKSGVEERNG
jgi:hypothetical protein